MDFIVVRVPMLGYAINAAALIVPIETQLGGHGDRSKSVPHDIDLAFQFVQHRSGPRAGVYEKRFRFGDSPQVVGTDLFYTEIKGTLAFGRFHGCDIPLVEQLEDKVLGFDVQHHDPIEKVLHVAHVVVADGGFFLVEHSHAFKRAEAEPLVAQAAGLNFPVEP